jgi:hypothetical protein
LELTAEEEAEAEEESEHSEEWLNAFSDEAEETATWEFAAGAEEEEVDNICFADLWEQIEALEERVRVQGRHIQQVRLEIGKKEGMGDHDDLPNGQKFLQLRRLQKQDQPWEQLDEVIEEIMELMLNSADTASRERLSRRKQQQQQQCRSSSSSKNGADGSSKDLFGIQEDFQQLRGEAHEQELMILQLRSLMQEHLSMQSASQPATSRACIQMLKGRRSLI